MSVQSNIQLDEQFIAAWNAHDPNAAVEVLSDEVAWTDVTNPQPMQGKDAIRAYLGGWFAAFPDLDGVVKNRVVTEDQIAAEIEFTGTNTGPLQVAPGMPAIPPTGRKVTGKGTYFVRVQNGKGVEVRSYPDVAGMMMQLGLMPMPGA